MTTKADVLAAREAYERVAEAYLRERGWEEYSVRYCERERRYWRIANHDREFDRALELELSRDRGEEKE